MRILKEGFEDCYTAIALNEKVEFSLTISIVAKSFHGRQDDGRAYIHNRLSEERRRKRRL